MRFRFSHSFFNTTFHSDRVELTVSGYLLLIPHSPVLMFRLQFQSTFLLHTVYHSSPASPFTTILNFPATHIRPFPPPIRRSPSSAAYPVHNLSIASFGPRIPSPRLLHFRGTKIPWKCGCLWGECARRHLCHLRAKYDSPSTIREG
jgi:hypothetical protein